MSKQRSLYRASRTNAKGHGRKKKKDTEEAVAKLPVLRPDAAGIDIGSEELWVSAPEDRDSRYGSFPPSPMR